MADAASRKMRALRSDLAALHQEGLYPGSIQTEHLDLPLASIFAMVEQYIYAVELDAQGQRQAYYHSPRLTPLTGYNPQDLIEKPSLWWEMIHPEDRDRVCAAQQGQLQDGQPLVLEHRLCRADGQVIWVRNNRSIAAHHSGQIITGSIVDITEERQRAEELEAARARAEDLAQERSSFLAMMSHELRTPMNGVLGMSALLLESSLDARQRNYAQTIHDAASDLLNLVADVLDVHRLEHHSLPINKRWTQLRRLCESVISLLAPLAEDKGLALRMVWEAGCPEEGLTDGERLRQVLLNLLGNAIKFTPQGWVELRVSRLTSLGIEWTIADSGPGFAVDINQQLGDSLLNTTADTADRRIGGSGLGLRLARLLTQALEGDLHIYSAPGHGSLLHVRLAIECRPITHKAFPCSARIALHPSLTQEEDQRILLPLFERLGISLSPLDQADLLVLSGTDTPPAWEEARCLRILGLRQSSSYSGAAQVLNRPLTLAGLHRALQQSQPLATDTHTPSNRRLLTHTAQTPILIADDEPANRMVAAAMCSQLGLQAMVVENGERAVEMAQGMGKGLAAILLDLWMPDRSGVDVCRAIRSALGEDSPPIIGWTAYIAADGFQSCLDAGMATVIEKPLTANKLIDALELFSQLRWEEETQPTSENAIAPTSSHVLDLELIAQQRSLPGGKDLLQELISIVESEGPRQLSLMQEQGRVGAALAVAKAAHRLRGCARAVGLRRLSEACSLIEVGARAGDLPSERSLAQLPSLINEGLEALRREVAR